MVKNGVFVHKPKNAILGGPSKNRKKSNFDQKLDLHIKRLLEWIATF